MPRLEELPHHEIIERLTPVGATITGLSTMWAWLGENNESISAACSILGVTIIIAGKIWSRWRRNSDES